MHTRNEQICTNKILLKQITIKTMVLNSLLYYLLINMHINSSETKLLFYKKSQCWVNMIHIK